MKATEICAKYNISYAKFATYINENKIPHSENFWGDKIIEDSMVETYVNAFLKNTSKEEIERKIEERKQLEAEAAALEAAEAPIKRKAMAEMLITSGFNFDGYKIKKYSGYISGDDAMTVNRGSSFTDGGVRDKLMESLSVIRRNALRELKEAAYDLGCNAVIGVDFDYITLDPQTANIAGGTTYQPYVFCVTANGNAVIIEKIEE